MKQYEKVSAREILIRKLKDMGEQGFLYERAIPRIVSSSRRKQVASELALLLSEGFVVRFGTGRRGSPHCISLSKTWPFNKCPLCGHTEHPVGRVQ
jgi:hypothetical protein